MIVLITPCSLKYNEYKLQLHRFLWAPLVKTILGSWAEISDIFANEHISVK